MKNIELLLKEASGIEQFSKGYFAYLYELLNRIDTKMIASFLGELEDARENQNTVFVIGNGGSASTASHMANDFSLGSRSEDNGLPYRLVSLADNVSAITASANDCGYDSVFLRQLQVHYKPGDKLVAISVSGNSPNVVRAAEWVKAEGGKVVGIVGFDGGKLKTISDIVMQVEAEKGEYGPVEDVHMILEHLIYTWIWFKKRKQSGI